MLVLITYDVNTEDRAGRTRLRKIADICTDYGQRVQNSVFECDVDSALLVKIRAKLLATIDKEKDSLRFYVIGSGYRSKIEHYGAKSTYLPDDPLIL